MVAKQFYFERDNKEFTVRYVEGKKMEILVCDPSKSPDKREATISEGVAAYQTLAYLFMRNLKQG
jgi:hypothetical protein